MTDHYTEALRLVEEGNLGDRDKATVHALLYVGDQLEVIAGIFGSASVQAESVKRPDALTREEVGL